MKTGIASFLRNMMRPVDLTSGKPWRVIMRYGAPIMLSYFLQQVYVLTDAIICGQVLSARQVAGVNDTFPLTFIFLQFAFGCTAGFSVITAGCVGRGDAKGVRQSLAAQIYLSVIISLLLTVISVAVLPWMLGIINVTQANKEVYDAAYTYCFIIFLGIIMQMGFNFICGILRAYGDSVTPLVFLVISTAMNVGLDILFLTVFGMGPAGAAAATVLTQALSVAGCFVYTFAKYREMRLSREDFRSGLRVLTAHLKQGIPLGLQFSVLAVGIIVMQGGVVLFDLEPSGIMAAGTPAQNGFGAAGKLINFLMSFFNGLGAAMLGFNAQNYGKGDYENIRRGTLQSLIIMMIIYAACLVCGLLLSIDGAYQYIFMSSEGIAGIDSLRKRLCVYRFRPVLYSGLSYSDTQRGAGRGQSGLCAGCGNSGADSPRCDMRVFAGRSKRRGDRFFGITGGVLRAVPCGPRSVDSGGAGIACAPCA